MSIGPARATGSSTARSTIRAIPWWAWAVLLTTAVSTASHVAAAPDLTSAGLAGATLRFAIPILLAGLAGLWSERSGSLTIGLDGMMVIGSWTGAWVGLSYGPWAALLGGVLGGVLVGLLHGLVTIGWGVDQAIAGIVVNMAAIGVVRFLSSVTFAEQPGGSISQSPSLDQLPLWSVPGAGTLLGSIADADVPVVSDGARVATGLLTDVSAGTVLALLLVPLTGWLLTRTRFGLHVRACGENPSAADSLGVSPIRVRYAAQAISGGLAGLGGAYLVVVASSLYREGQVAGRGFLGLATVVFGNWTPGGVLGGSVLFGFTDALTTRQAASVEALLLVGGAALLVRATWLVWRRRHLTALVHVGIALAVLTWFVAGDSVPRELVGVAPYLTTLIVLVLARQSLRPPSAVGTNYRRAGA